VLIPWPEAWLTPLSDDLMRRIPLLDNPWAAGGCWLLAAYLSGFLLRLTSIELLNALTWTRWAERLTKEAARLAPPIKAAIKDDAVITALTSAEQSGKPGVTTCAPYFHFVKRIVRTRPELWVEAERLEAEVRLAAGLLIPFVILAVAGILRFRHPAAAIVLFAIGTSGAAIVLWTFPERRVKEVVYDHLLALVAMRQSRLNDATDAPANSSQKLSRPGAGPAA
jgi:hypothetical protein